MTSALSKDVVEFPELNKVYLCRRHKGGSEVKRFQPARIVEIRKDDDGVYTYTLKWLYDPVSEVHEYISYHGFVKALTPEWIKIEHHRQFMAQREAQVALNVLNDLQDLD